MAGKPIATIGSMHMCPMCSGTVPHVGGPVSGPGMAGATINGQPVAVMGDMCTCVGPPDVIAQGCPGATINGVPVATVGCMTAHGGQIVQGAPGATVGPTTPTPNTTMPVREIPFPEIRILDRVGAAVTGNSNNLNEAINNQEALRNEAESNEGEPKIYNLQWVKEERVVRDSEVIKKVTLKANVINIGDGTNITFKVRKPVLNDNNEEQEEDIVELSGTVSDKQVVVEWEVEDPEQNNSNQSANQ